LPTSARKASARSSIQAIKGDMASGPLDARRAMDALMALDAGACARRGHDRYLIED